MDRETMTVTYEVVVRHRAGEGDPDPAPMKDIAAPIVTHLNEQGFDVISVGAERSD